MRILVLLSLLCATSLGAGAGVDGLTPEQVAKAVAALKENFVRPEALSDQEMARATLEGLLDRLAPEAALVTGTGRAEAASPFYSEDYQGTGYLRLGELTPGNVEKAKATLKEWSGKGVGAAVLDLRGTPATNDFNAAANLAGLFSPERSRLFGLAFDPKIPAVTGSNFTIVSRVEGGLKGFFADLWERAYTGVVVVLVDGETAEAPEAVAATLQKSAKALLVGEKTSGRAFVYRDFPLDGAVLRVAVAQVLLPDGTGMAALTPDIDAGLDGARKKELMASITAKGVDSVVEEHDRAHLNEAALVSRSDPEVDELEAEQAGRKPPAALIDRQLQRALDLVTSISIYQAKGQARQ